MEVEAVFVKVEAETVKSELARFSLYMHFFVF